ncbi:MAG TPA: trehalase family glycosidase [Candidatus Saccharimonadales bacterium]|nr:trehalase family glycosidase [Candidatus Saccharimonadales bacterium]
MHVMDPAAEAFIKVCSDVLEKNAIDGYTVPSRHIYPHQWLWDSCFTAIGLRHVDIRRARKELRTLKRGAWSNGMMPNMIFHESFLNFDHTLWKSKSLKEAPRNVSTTCITQPPMLAEAVFRVGQSMPKAERLKWYRSMLGCIKDYHKWLYTERDPDGDGLVVQLHPYESGMDNSPPWMYVLSRMNHPWWLKIFNKHSIKIIINHFRRDGGFVPVSQRIGLRDALRSFYAIKELAKRKYKYANGDKNQVVVQDLMFNCILIRANKLLLHMAEATGEKLPSELTDAFASTEQSLEKLWSHENNRYYSRNFLTKRLIKQDTLSAFMPLYAGCISKSRAEILARRLRKAGEYGTDFPVPSVPLDSVHFRKRKYWQGPSWANTNWLIIQGLKNYGFDSLAGDLRHSTLLMIARSGSYEYFSPLDGAGEGIQDFSWTASLAIDLLKTD